MEIARKFHKSTGIIFINSSPGDCIARNENRPDHIASMEITNLFARLELPDTGEGFAEVLILN